MLNEITNISGFDGSFEDIELLDDLPLDITRVKFFLKSEEMPYLTEQAGKIIRKNFVWIEKVMNLGNAILLRRIKDTVEFDENIGKWKVKKLAAGEESDIRRYPNEWNHFYRGASEDIVGTPLTFLFKNDPSKVELYKAKYIHTIEQLSACTDTHISELGVGSREDVVIAKAYLKKIADQAPAIEINNKLEEKDRKIETLSQQVQDLTSKLTELLRAQLEEAPKAQRGRKPKIKPDDNEVTL